MVQWLRLRAVNAGGMGSIPGQGTNIPHAVWHAQKIKQTKNKTESPEQPSLFATVAHTINKDVVLHFLLLL